MARILLADDDTITRELVKRAVEMDGHAVELAEDGLEAKSAFDKAARPFDLLVTDVGMPGIDGVELARHALAGSPRIRVLMMSGYTDSLERGRALNPVRIGVIAKPFTLDQIRRSIAAALG